MIDFGELFAAVRGERIETVRPRGDGGWAIATMSFIIHARRLGFPADKPLEGRTIVAAYGGGDPLSWTLVLDDHTIVTLELVEAVKRGLTPVEGLPVVPRKNGDER